MGNKIQAVVLGRNWSSLLGMIRAAGQAGCDVTVVRTVRKIPQKGGIKGVLRGAPIESASKYVKKYLYAIEPDREGLIELLLREFKAVPDKVVLLPTDDFTASTIDIFQEQLRGRFSFPNIDNKPGAVVELMDKNIQKELARSAGLAVAEGWSVSIKDGVYQIPNDIQYPCFTKPQISFMGNKRFMKKCSSYEELKEIADEVQKTFACPILVEQFVEIEKEYAILGFCDGKRVIMPGIIQLELSGHGSHKGVTLFGNVFPVNGFEKLLEMLTNFMLMSSFTGLFDVDVYKSGDRLYFNELNLRFGASGYAITSRGVSLPAYLINYLLGRKETAEVGAIKGFASFVNEKVNLEDYAAGYISWDEYKKNNNKADFHFVKNDDDPMPYKYFRRNARLIRLKKAVKKVIGR